jgi:hypothetical protein
MAGMRTLANKTLDNPLRGVKLLEEISKRA